jgi:acetyl esterase/lipase
VHGAPGGAGESCYSMVPDYWTRDAPNPRAGAIAAVAIAVVLLGVSCWTIVPGPTLVTLAFAVVIPEVAPIALPIGVLLTLIVARLAVGRPRTLAVIVAIAADLCLGWPLVALPFAQHAADVTLNGAGYPPVSPAALAIDVTHDLPVRLRDGGTLALDLYRPVTGGARPLLVTIYGGAWTFGSRDKEAPLARRYAAQGYAVAVIDYRHAPRYRFPAQYDDVEDALRTLAAHAHDWHIDPQRAALLGRSSGAQLALLAAERPGPLRVRAVIAFYAPTDLAGGWETPPRPDPLNVRSVIGAYLGGPPDAAHHRIYDAASPSTQTHRGIPPALLVIGDRDEVVLPRFQRAFAARLRASGVPVVALELPWSNHAFDEVGGSGARIANDATARFLAVELGGGALARSVAKASGTEARRSPSKGARRNR